MTARSASLSAGERPGLAKWTVWLQLGPVLRLAYRFLSSAARSECGKLQRACNGEKAACLNTHARG